MLALIHIFVYILEYPTLPSVDTDISLMHEAAAHFNFLEYRTGSWSLPFVRDLANLVRIAVARQRERCSFITTSMCPNLVVVFVGTDLPCCRNRLIRES